MVRPVTGRAIIHGAAVCDSPIMVTVMMGIVMSRGTALHGIVRHCLVVAAGDVGADAGRRPGEGEAEEHKDCRESSHDPETV